MPGRRRKIRLDGGNENQGNAESSSVEKKRSQGAHRCQGGSSKRGAYDGGKLERRGIDRRGGGNVFCICKSLKGAVGGGFEKRHEEGYEKNENVEKRQGKLSPCEKSRKPQQQEKAQNIRMYHAFFPVKAIRQGAHEGAEKNDGNHGDSHEQSQVKAAVFASRVHHPPCQGDGEKFIPHRGSEASAEKLAKIRKKNQGVISPVFPGKKAHEVFPMRSRISWAAMAQPLCFWVPPRRIEAM